MAEEHFVVIGNGPAGRQAARTLREGAPSARITLLSKEQGPGYRHRLLPNLIADAVEEDALYLSSFKDCETLEIKLRCGQEVVGLDLEKRELILDHKEILRFNGLVIAVGGRPHIPEPYLPFRECMLSLKTLEDARTWKTKLSQVESVLMIGGDLTSFAMTNALLQMQKAVYFLLNEKALWPLRPDSFLLDKIRRRLEGKGVHLLQGVKLREMIRTSEKSVHVQTEKESVEVGLVGAFFGLVPDIHFLTGSGLSVDRGILVDEYLNVGVEGVYAAGDCAQVYHPELKDYWVSIGHDNARALGRIAAVNLLGGRVRATAPKESIYEVQGVKVNNSWWMDY
jgi:NAD(P)H-nitrite reductase large subunit